MRFYLKKRRQPPAVIIVALIDILIVLLIFLMVTTSFTRMPAVRLSLPESTTAKKAGATESPPMIVTIDAKGNVLLGTESKPVTVAQLKAELVAAVARNPNLKVTISADTVAPMGRFVRVCDVVKETNIKERVVSILVKEAAKP
ncbi:MAG: ExbD/TolR family protein [Limisphaerales bacterium]|jgi:biopolymer transport protein ExbD